MELMAKDMVTSGQQCNMNSAVRMNADNKAVMNGEILSGLNEVEQNAQELKELLKTAELAGYRQGGTMQFYADAMQTDNSELMQIMNGLEVSMVCKNRILFPTVAQFPRALQTPFHCQP